MACRRCVRWAIRIDSLLPAYAHASQLWRAAGAQEDFESIDAIRHLVPLGGEADEDWWDRIAQLGETYRDTYLDIARGTGDLLSRDMAWGLEDSTLDWDAAAMRLVDALKQVDPEWFTIWEGPKPPPRRWTMTRRFRWHGDGFPRGW